MNDIEQMTTDKVNITVCDKCKRHTECFKKGRLIVWFTTSDLGMAKDYDYKGTHGTMWLDAYCPEGKLT